MVKLPGKEEIEEAIGPIENFYHNCHGASLRLVQSGLIEGRVARGMAKSISDQHSWVVLGMDCWDPEVKLLDLTAWSYDRRRARVWYATNYTRHTPHGSGAVWNAPMPSYHGGPIIMPEVSLSRAARSFIHRCAPRGLDARGWHELGKLPVRGWPAREIIEAMLDTPRLRAFVPIDITGMLTNRNPGGLYLRAEKDAA